LHYVPDPSSQAACTVGGNVAENAGGPHCLKYGVTTNHIVRLDVVLPDGSTYPTRGRLNFTGSQIDPRLATLQLRAEFPNAGSGLMPGQFVRVQIVAGKRDNVFLVPQVSVTQTETGYLVFVLDAQGKAELRPIKVGDWVGKDWTVLEGLKAGDKVVVDNLQKLRPGSTVAPVADTPAAPAKTASAK